MKVLQRNLNRSTFVVWEMKRNVPVVRFKYRCNILIDDKIIKEMPGSVASETPFIFPFPDNALDIIQAPLECKPVSDFNLILFLNLKLV